MAQNEYINHFNAIRLRVTGAGNLKGILYSYDEVVLYNLVDLDMDDPNSKVATQLVNFNQTVAKLKLYTTDINDVLSISQIMIYSKPIATSFPG